MVSSAIHLTRVLEEQGWKFCFIGGLAVQFWGEPRNTIDLNLTLLSGFGKELPYIDYLAQRFAPRREDYREFALANRVILLRDAQGVPLDICLGGMPFEYRTVERAVQVSVTTEETIPVCSASDLVVHKAFAGRDRDWFDLDQILIRSKDILDWRLIEFELLPLLELKSAIGNWDRLRAMRSALN